MQRMETCRICGTSSKVNDAAYGNISHTRHLFKSQWCSVWKHIAYAAPLQKSMMQRVGLTIWIPPRIHRICTLCCYDYIVPVSEDQTICRKPCQKCESCRKCKKIKKKMPSRKPNLMVSLYVTCSFKKHLELEAESQGTVRFLLEGFTAVHSINSKM